MTKLTLTSIQSPHTSRQLPKKTHSFNIDEIGFNLIYKLFNVDILLLKLFKKIRILPSLYPPSSSKGCTHSKAEGKGFTTSTFFDGNSLPFPISSVPSFSPASQLFFQSVHFYLFLHIFYLHIFRPPYPTGFKVRETTLTLRTPEKGTKRVVTAQQ